MVDLNPETAGTIAAVPPPVFTPRQPAAGSPPGPSLREERPAVRKQIAETGRAVIMTVKERTQVGIVGAGPAGLLLSHLLALGGVESRVVEARSRAYCEARQRAGMLEPATVRLLRDAGLGRRLDAEGLEHDGIYLQFSGERHHVNFRELTGKRVTIYPQTEIVRDLIRARIAGGASLEFRTSDTKVSGLDSDRPVLSYTDAAGQRHEVTCDAIAGCDGFRGVCRPAIPAGGLRTLALRTYPYSWLGILAQAPPSTDQVIYARHDRGFALISTRSPGVQRMYFQCDPAEKPEDWSDDRIWAELQTRVEGDGFRLKEGPIFQKGVVPMRSYVREPMQSGRLFLAGDAAHTVPPTGAKGLNLAVADVFVLARGFEKFYGVGSSDGLETYSKTALRRIWRVQHFSWWMTSMLHRFDGASAFDQRRQLAELDLVTSSTAASKTIAENYVGMPLA